MVASSATVEGQLWGARYTLGGRDDAEARVRRDLARAARCVRTVFGKRLRLCALAGGYARGEGAVEVHRGGVFAHNDYDLLAVLDAPEPQDALRGRRAGVLAAPSPDVEVDVAVMSTERFLNPPATLFWLDATRGGLRWLDGDEGLIDRVAPVLPRHVPLSEAGRLLTNRAVGLALSSLGGDFGELSVMARHGHKAVLAVGDALLLAVDRYEPTLQARALALANMAGAPRIEPWLIDGYREALRFRLDTVGWRPASGGGIEPWFHEVRRRVGAAHLAFEHWRVGAPDELTALAVWKGELFVERPDARLSPTLAALRAWVRGSSPLLPRVVHPRERLARAAALLAYGGAAERVQAASLLGISASSSNAVVRGALLRLRSVGS